MKRCLRWILGLIFVLAVSIYVLIVTLPLLFNPNDHKALISDLVRKQTGMELVINGDIQLQVSPGLHVTCALTKVHLSNNTLFQNSTFIDSEETKIELSLWPLLLQQRLHMTAIMADGVTLNLLRTKEGTGNWDNLTHHFVPINEAPGETPAMSEQRQPSLLTRFLPGLTGLDLGKVQLSRINVRYDNRQSDRVIILKELKIRSGRIREEGQFPFEAAFNLLLDKKDAIIRSVDIAMQGNGTLFLQDPHLLLEDFRMKGVLKGNSLPKRGLKLAFSTNSDLHLRRQKMDIKDFSLNYEDATLQGSGTLEYLSSPRFNLSLSLPECSPKFILTQLQAALPFLQDADPFTHVSAGLLVKGDMERTEISDFTIMADETTVTGSIKIEDLRNPAYEAIIHVNHLDLDRYAPPKTAMSPETDEEQTTPIADDLQTEAAPPVIPVHFLRSLPLQLDLQLDSMKVGGAELSQVQIMLSGHDGIFQVTPLTAKLYGGSMKVKATLDVTGDLPRLQIRPSIKQVQLVPLLQKMFGKAEVTGVVLLQADIQSSGLSPEELLSHINGTLQFEILNGEIKAVTIMPIIRTTLALHRKEAAQPLATEEATGFDRLSGTAIIEDGILHTDDLMAASEKMQMTGAGEIDLARRQIDFLLNISLSPDLAQDKEMGLTELDGRIIPYTIFGPFNDLKQEADFEKLLPTESRQEPLKKLEEQPEAAPAQNKQEIKGD
jgi:AsmA protein